MCREAAWRLAENFLKLKEKIKQHSSHLRKNWCLPAPSNLKLEEREFVVDSGASMHMISKKDLNSAEMDTLTKSCSPPIVITANGEVQTHEEATVYVKELDIFLTIESPRGYASSCIARKALRWTRITGKSHWTNQAEMHRWNSDQTSEKHLQICTVSTVNLEKSDLNQFLFINTKGGIRRLLHPVPHGGSGMNTGGAHKLKNVNYLWAHGMSSIKERWDLF